jgi:hypothetical protein
MNFDLVFYQIDHRLVALVMLGLLTAAGEIGFRSGSRKRGSEDSYRSLVSGTSAAMLGLLALLLGFTLSMGVSRWNDRHEVIVNESNAIGTLWLRSGLLETPLRDVLRGALREYTDIRIALGGVGGEREALRVARSKSESLHTSIWSVVEQANQPSQSNAVLSSLINGANELIDIHELRFSSIENFLPATLFVLLTTIASVAMAFFAWSFGASEHGRRTANLMLGLLISAVLLVIMDVNRPQRGRIMVGVESLERVSEPFASTPNVRLENDSLKHE